MFGLIKQAFIALLRFSGSSASILNAFNFTTCTSLNDHPVMTRPTRIDLYIHLWLI